MPLEDQVLKYISEHWPKLTFAGSVVIAIIFGTYKVTKAISHWKDRIEAAEKDCKKIETYISPQLTAINTSISTLSSSFKGLVIHLQAKDVTFDANLFVSHSPIQLTRLGLEILNLINGDKYINDNVDFLIKEMDVQGVKTALDSQIIAPIVISKVSEDDNFKHIKDFLFNHPIFNAISDNGDPLPIYLSIKVISQVMGVYLRDKYLERHPELNPDDIPSVKTKG